jgi:hypothetical protein
MLHDVSQTPPSLPPHPPSQGTVPWWYVHEVWSKCHCKHAYNAMFGGATLLSTVLHSGMALSSRFPHHFPYSSSFLASYSFNSPPASPSPVSLVSSYTLPLCFLQPSFEPFSQHILVLNFLLPIKFLFFLLLASFSLSFIVFLLFILHLDLHHTQDLLRWRSPVEWTPWSPDLNILDFTFCRFLKTQAYVVKYPRSSWFRAENCRLFCCCSSQCVKQNPHSRFEVLRAVKSNVAVLTMTLVA